MIDGEEADDKIVAVLEGDAAYGGLTDISQCPAAVLNRLRHYFLTYKQAPTGPSTPVEIPETYGRDEAHEVIRRSQADYAVRYAGLEDLLNAALGA
jgi:inorganic pyrophosphatase